ncbi:MAG: hypothetical protein RLP44_05090 [Aggregatilineales bacterium]
MRKLILLTLLLLIAVTLPARADDDDYRLREPDAEAYMRTVPAVIEQAFTEGDSYFYGSLRKIVAQEFSLRYATTNLTNLPFSALEAFQTSVAIGPDIHLPIDVSSWFEAMLTAGLRESQMSNLPDEFTIGNFDVISTPVDFDGNGVEEHLLEVHDTWSMRQFYVLLDNENIQLLPLPIVGLLDDAVTRGMSESGHLAVIDIVDLDGDGGDDIIFEGDGYGYWASCGDLYFVTHENGELVNRAGDLFGYCIPMAQNNTASVEFETENPENIQMVYTWLDGWNCQITRIDTLNMLEDTLDSTTTYDNSVWCDLREAGNAFISYDYEVAVEIYARVLPEFDGQMAQYLVARLVLSYALNGQLEEVQTTLDMIEPSGQMGELVMRLQAGSDQPEAMCQTAYDFFSEINRATPDEYTNPYEWTPQNFFFGHENTDPRYFPLPDPKQAGCDYRPVMGIEPTAFPTSETRIPDVYRFVAFDAYQYARRENYQSLLADIELIFAQPEALYADYSPYLAYWRALALESLNRPDEALAEYVAIYEAAPESAWGMLAALHFEPVE